MLTKENMKKMSKREFKTKKYHEKVYIFQNLTKATNLKEDFLTLRPAKD